MRFYFGFPLAVLFASTQALAADPLISKIEEFKLERAVLFVSDCQIGEVKFVMIFRAGELQGGYGQMAIGSSKNRPMTLNSGVVNIENGDWKVVASTGGVMTSRSQTEVMDYLMKMPFHIVPTRQLDDIYQKPSLNKCNFP